MNQKIWVFGVIFSLFTVSFVSGTFDLTVEKIDKGSVIISELNNPAVYEFNINNPGNSEMAEIYSLVGVSMGPKGTFLIPSGTSKVEIKAYPGKEFRRLDGYYNFEYQIRGLESGIFKDKLTFRVVSLKDVLSIGDIKIHPNDQTVDITIKNNVNTHLEDVEVIIASSFFESTEKISLKPFEEIKIPVEIKKDKISGLVAGQYFMKISVKMDDAEVDFKGDINYLEKEGTSVIKKTSGIIIRETTVTKTNEGNIPTTVVIDISKDILSRLFTTFSLEPTTAERSGIVVDYAWQKDIGPNESFTISSTTNYTFPFVILILVIIVGFLARAYSMTALTVNKKVSFVKTKGGEFALKVIVNVKAKRHIDNIQIVDRLPMMAKLYEKFGRSPDRIDEASRRLFWDIPRLNKGEERVFSYIVYSKVRAVGRFELPPALAIFEKDGKTQEVLSNRAYFVSETSEE
ncbi:MAG: hypothetical protein Q7S27_00975 [Nanoarchaeota archaeon]|nr:hypothetical protein [Nanoarchaeota archaeon]